LQERIAAQQKLRELQQLQQHDLQQRSVELQALQQQQQQLNRLRSLDLWQQRVDMKRQQQLQRQLQAAQWAAQRRRGLSYTPFGVPQLN